MDDMDSPLGKALARAAENHFHKRVDEIINTATKSLERYFGRYSRNIERAVRLVLLYESLYSSSSLTQKNALDDVLRAVVVFLHASLEDLLRTIASACLPQASPEVLNKMPLAGITPSGGRAEKYVLGQLSQHRSKTVDQVISESVQQYIARITFNNTTEIASMLSNIGVPIDNYDNIFRDLDEMIRRRHQIVHQTDISSVCESDNISDYLTPINISDIKRWFKTSLEFSGQTLASLGVNIARKMLDNEFLEFDV